ncbi:MAG: DUF2254 domain-containing protein [Myxococcales bacterium]|nr:DUF2254 domain-containing protein [Myxococcales bacterium]
MSRTSSPARRQEDRSNLWRSFAWVVGASLSLVIVTTAVEILRLKSGVSWGKFLLPTDLQSAATSLEGVLETMISLLGLTITVVSIVVQLAAQRYTPKITELFLKDRYNVGFFLLMVVTSIFILLTRTTLHQDFVPTASVTTSVVLVMLSLALLAPYMGYVFKQLQPKQVISTIKQGGVSAMRGEGLRQHLTLDQRQTELVQSIEIIADITINSIAQGDRGQAMHAIDAISEIYVDYLEAKSSLPKLWRRTSKEMFLTISPEFFDEITRTNVWVEAKILMELEVIFEAALQHQVNVISNLATVIREAGLRALHLGDHRVLRLETNFFNNFCRQAINKSNLRAIYSIFYHYRLLTEALMDDAPDLMLDVMIYIKYYGQLANQEGLPFAMVIAAYDLSTLCETAYHRNYPKQREALAIFLELDEDPENDEQEKANRGVRKAQAILASFYIEVGATEFVEAIANDMAEETPDRLRSIRDELRSVHHSKFWEVTDRGINFDFVPEERRAFLDQYFELAIGKASDTASR